MAVKARASITLSFMIDIVAVYRYYKLQSSTATAPSVPTTDIPSGWDDVEPNYTSGSTNTLYFVDKTVFSNGTYLYSLVSKSSSYEAAKEAYNKASSAASAASTANSNASAAQITANDAASAASSAQSTADTANSNAVAAAKTATNFMQYDSTNGLQIGNRTSGSWSGMRARVKPSSFDIVDANGNVLSSFGSSSIEFDKQVTFKADGITLDNGDAFTELGKNNILWSHATGYFMNASHVLALSSNISRQLSGAVFAWCGYASSKPTNANWLYFFVPKAHVLNHAGTTVRMSDPYMGVCKYLYVSNGTVTGVASNGQSGTTNGIAFDNTKYVLRYIIGV